MYKWIFPYFRKARMAKFERALQPSNKDVVLDIGGHTGIWNYTEGDYTVELLNLTEDALSRVDNPRFRYRVGDATKMECSEGEYDICFSNSVIEHVYTWENQQKFAEACRRIAPKIWVQTPAKCFPIEPHFIGLFGQWLPKPLRAKWMRWLTFWGYYYRPSPERVNQMVEEIRLTYREIGQLFPDCEIIRERFLGIFVKSYIAKRT